MRNVCVYIYYIDMYNIDGGRNCDNCVRGTVGSVCVYIYYIDMYNIDGGRRNCTKCVHIYIYII